MPRQPPYCMTSTNEDRDMRNVLTLFDLSTAEIERIFEISSELKAKLQKGQREALLPGRMVAMLFEKPSLRTRVSFETAIRHLGGGAMFLGDDVGWGDGESAKDFGQVISQYVDVIVCRAKSHQKVEELAQYCTCSVINGLTDLYHPCQALADLFTVREIHGNLAGRRIAYVGDANNVARSLALACGKLNMAFSIASPDGYTFDQDFLQRLSREVPRLDLTQVTNPVDAVKNADAVYTDVWASMGQEAEQAKRQEAFADYQVNEALMAQAPSHAVFLHCLPARRGEEVSDAVIDGDQSAIVQQAGNRLHAQKGLLAFLLDADVSG